MSERYRIKLKDSIPIKIAYHGTSKENAKNILKSGFKGDSVFLIETAYEAEGYGEAILKVDVSPLKLYLLSKQDLEDLDYSKREGYDGIIYRYSEEHDYNIQVFNVSKLNTCDISLYRFRGGK